MQDDFALDRLISESTHEEPPPIGFCSKMGSTFKLATRYSIVGDSVFSNLKRNIWCNAGDLVRYSYRKIIEPTNISSSQRKNLRYDVIDLYKTVEEDPITMSEQAKEDLKTKDVCTRVVGYFLLEQTWLLLMLLGIFSAIMAILIEFSVNALIDLREQIQEWFIQECGETTRCKFGLFCVYVSYCTLFCLLSGIIVRYISPQASGSGLPEIKSILSGVVLPRYLSHRTFVAKTMGLICALVGGLSIGREGPFVHICGIIANQLSKIKFFNRSRKNEALRFQLLAAGCAAGVACIFGAPIGGVLFAIEVTATYFQVQNLWKAFFSAIAATLLVKLGGQSGLIAMFATNFTQATYRSWELIAYVLIGVSFGYIGAMFVRLVLKMVHLRRDYKILAETRYIQLVIIGMTTACVIYPFSAVQSGSDAVINGLFGTDPESIAPWVFPSIFLNLGLFVILKFILTAISLGLPVPCGLYTPVFLIGAAGGRFIGEFMALLFEDGYIIPGGYAVVGAAAMSAGVTRTLSTAVIVFELTGQLEFLIPVLLATIIATAVGNQFSAGVYDTLLEQKRLPYMAPFGNLRMPNDMKTAAQLMRRDVICLEMDTTYNDISHLIDAHHFQSYPVVDSEESMVLCGSISRSTLVALLEKQDYLFCNTIESQLLKKLNQSSTREDTVERLKNRYKFKEESRETSLDEEEDYSIVEDDLSQKREKFFNVSIADKMIDMPRSDFDRSPFQIPEETHFYQIHFMFVMLGLSHAFITRNGHLVGVITKKDFLEKTRSQIMWQ